MLNTDVIEATNYIALITKAFLKDLVEALHTRHVSHSLHMTMFHAVSTVGRVSSIGSQKQGLYKAAGHDSQFPRYIFGDRHPRENH